MKIQILYYCIMNILKNSKRLGTVMIIFALSLYIFIQKYEITKLENKIVILNTAIDNSFSEIVDYLESYTEVSFNGITDCDFPLKDVLIYRFSDDMCDECIRQDLHELYKFQKLLGKQSLIIFPAFEEKEWRCVENSGLLNEFCCKNIPESVFSFPFNISNGTFKRYLAYVGADGKIKSVFFPEKYKQNLTNIYLQGVKNKINRIQE